LEGKAGVRGLSRFGRQIGRVRWKNERDRKRASYSGRYLDVIAGAAYLGHVVQENNAKLVVYLNEIISLCKLRIKKELPSVVLRPSSARRPSLPIKFHDSAQRTIAVSLIFKPSRTALDLARVSSRSLEAK
jgi:hypothetical protein